MPSVETGMIPVMGLEHTTFEQRRRAATALVMAGELDGDVALSYVLWPTWDDLPRDLTVFRELAPPAAGVCSAYHGDKRCEAEADPDFGLCEDHIWALLTGEQFDYWRGLVAA